MPDDYECVDGIKVLSTLCDERGLKHWGSEAMACETHVFVDKVGNPHECWEAPDGMVNVVVSMSPERAVELGRGECHDEGTFHSWGYFTCSNCKVVVPVEAVREAPSIGKVVPISFCPNCGAKVVSE